jgi:hypothetical protein
MLEEKPPPGGFFLQLVDHPLLVIPAALNSGAGQAGTQLLALCWFIGSASAGLRLACGEPVTFWHCPKSNQKG